MKKVFNLILIGLLAAFVGCSSVEPYAYRNNWVMRDNATPQYFADYDVILFFKPTPERYQFENKQAISLLYDELHERFSEKFGIKVRIFSPLVREGTDIEDARLAVEHYLKHYHDEGRHFIVFIEGRDEQFERDFREELEDSLQPKKGFVLLKSEEHFTVDEKLATRIGNAVYRRKIKSTWGTDELEEEVLEDEEGAAGEPGQQAHDNKNETAADGEKANEESSVDELLKREE